MTDDLEKTYPYQFGVLSRAVKTASQQILDHLEAAQKSPDLLNFIRLKSLTEELQKQEQQCCRKLNQS